MRYQIIAALGALFPWVAGAFALGEADVRSRVGQPLDARVAISAAPGELVDDSCFAMGPLSNQEDFIRQARLSVVREDGRMFLKVETFAPVLEPAVRLQVRAGCVSSGSTLVRTFQLLLDPPASRLEPAVVTPAVAAPAATAPAVPPAAAPAPATAPAAPTAVAPGSDVITVKRGDTLRSLSKQRYPQSRPDRIKFLAAVRQANPKIAEFASTEQLPVDAKLTVPPIGTASPTKPASAPASTAAPAPAAPAKAPPAKATTKKEGSAPPKLVEPTTATKPPSAARRSAQQSDTPVAPVLPRPAPRAAGDFALRLSGASVDTSRPASAERRRELREKQIQIEKSDDQVATILSLQNSVKQLENRVADLQLKLAKLPPSAAPSTPTVAAVPAPAVAKPAPALPPAKVEAPAPAVLAKAEPTKIEPPKVEAPKVELPKAEPPKTEPAKIEPPKAEAPKPEPPKPEAPKPEAPKPEAPKPEAAAPPSDQVAVPATATDAKPQPAQPAPSAPAKATQKPLPKAAPALDSADSGISPWWLLALLPIPLIGVIWWRSRKAQEQAREWEEQIAETLAKTGTLGPVTQPRETQPRDPVVRVRKAEEATETLAPRPIPMPVRPPSPAAGVESALASARASVAKAVPPTPAPPPAPVAAPAAPVKSQLQGLLVDPEIAQLSRALAPEPVDDLSLTRKLEVIQAEAEEAARTKVAAESARGKFADPELEARLNTLQKTGKTAAIGDVDPAQVKNYRLRYMEERFPEIANGTISLDDPNSIIKGARLFFEDGASTRAEELLMFSVEENPQAVRIWLAMFEIYRLENKVTDFEHLAKRFKQAHEFDSNWPKVQAIGLDLDSANPLYHERSKGLDVDQVISYDPLVENWLNAPIDFTPDVLAIELRQTLLQVHKLTDADLAPDPLPVVKELVQVPHLD